MHYLFWAYEYYIFRLILFWHSREIFRLGVCVTTGWLLSIYHIKHCRHRNCVSWSGLLVVLGVSVMQTVFSWDSFLTSIWHHLNGRNVIIILAPSLTSQCLTLNKTDVHQDSTCTYYTSELFLALISHYQHWITKNFVWIQSTVANWSPPSLTYIQWRVNLT